MAYMNMLNHPSYFSTKAINLTVCSDSSRNDTTNIKEQCEVVEIR